jgi:hypothetical protein
MRRLPQCQPATTGDPEFRQAVWYDLILTGLRTSTMRSSACWLHAPTGFRGDAQVFREGRSVIEE